LTCNPGPTSYQVSQARKFDPYPDPSMAPAIVGGRPIDYMEPRPEPDVTKNPRFWLAPSLGTPAAGAYLPGAVIQPTVVQPGTVIQPGGTIQPGVIAPTARAAPPPGSYVASAPARVAAPATAVARSSAVVPATAMVPIPPPTLPCTASPAASAAYGTKFDGP
jgi:hypothetical protein